MRSLLLTAIALVMLACAPPLAAQTCTPMTLCPTGTQCGPISNGCGGTLNCGSCPAGMMCSAGKCASATCTPKTCAQLGLVCGAASDGCGGSLQCGTCPGGTSCSAGQCVKGVKK